LTIRCLAPPDLPQVAGLYRSRLENSTFARLGLPFLQELLAGIDACPHGVVLVDAEDATVRGFMAATVEVTDLYAWLRRHRGLRLGLAALPGLLRRPGLIPQLWRTGGYFDEVGERDVTAELLYVAVRPELAQTKLSSQLLAAMLTALRERGVPAVKVTCEADNLPPQHLLTAFGFTRGSKFAFYGKPMVVFVNRNLAEARRDA
jgi:ribosomal protein S18 acetylase RimI-like enzyme